MIPACTVPDVESLVACVVPKGSDDFLCWRCCINCWNAVSTVGLVEGIIKAIVELQKWGTADTSEYPPGWEIETDGSGNITGGSFNPAPKNGDLWFDERQGRLFVWLDDAYYQTNGADGIPTVDATPPTQEVIGALWYNTGNQALYIWNGSTWDQVTAPTGFSTCLLYTSPSPRDMRRSRMPSSA